MSKSRDAVKNFEQLSPIERVDILAKELTVKHGKPTYLDRDAMPEYKNVWVSDASWEDAQLRGLHHDLCDERITNTMTELKSNIFEALDKNEQAAVHDVYTESNKQRLDNRSIGSALPPEVTQSLNALDKLVNTIDKIVQAHDNHLHAVHAHDMKVTENHLEFNTSARNDFRSATRELNKINQQCSDFKKIYNECGLKKEENERSLDRGEISTTVQSAQHAATAPTSAKLPPLYAPTNAASTQREEKNCTKLTFNQLNQAHGRQVPHSLISGKNSSMSVSALRKKPVSRMGGAITVPDVKKNQGPCK